MRLYKTATPDGVERLPSGGIKYRGETFPGYNKPKAAPAGSGKKKRVLAKKGDKVKVVNFGQRGYKHNYSAKAKKSYLARSAGIKGKDDKFSANYWSRRVLWPSGQKADGSSKKTAAEEIHINKPDSSPEFLRSQLRQIKKLIRKSSDEEVAFAKYIASKHENTPKEFAKLVRKHNPDVPDWKIDPDMDEAFVRDVLTKANKSRYYLKRPHRLEGRLGVELGLPSEMARSWKPYSSSYPSFHSAVAGYLGEHSKRQIPEAAHAEVDALVDRIRNARHILGFHTPQDTTEGARIGRDYALSQLGTKTAQEALYRPRGTIFVTDGKGNVLAGKRGVDSPASYGSSSLYYFPGGGIGEEGRTSAPSKKEILEGVRRESLEELGFKIKKLKLLRNKGVRVDMPDWWVDRQYRKRGVEYKGLDEYFVHAQRGEDDSSIHGSEGDAFRGSYYPIKDIVKRLAKEHEDDPSSSTAGNMVQAQLLSKLSSATKSKKKEDHPTQRLRERTNMDPKVIDKLRASIKKNQHRIPDGDHHVELDDGARAVIKEIRRRHVLATILASNMNRYPGQNLQYLYNTKTAGFFSGVGKAMRFGVNPAAQSAIGAGAYGLGAKLDSKGGSSVGKALKGVGAAGMAIGGTRLGYKGISAANKALGKRMGRAADHIKPSMRVSLVNPRGMVDRASRAYKKSFNKFHSRVHRTGMGGSASDGSRLGDAGAKMTEGVAKRVAGSGITNYNARRALAGGAVVPETIKELGTRSGLKGIQNHLAPTLNSRAFNYGMQGLGGYTVYNSDTALGKGLGTVGMVFGNPILRRGFTSGVLQRLSRGGGAGAKTVGGVTNYGGYVNTGAKQIAKAVSNPNSAQGIIARAGGGVMRQASKAIMNPTSGIGVAARAGKKALFSPTGIVATGGLGYGFGRAN